jgi:nucleoside-diphosphate-sugar epimerase
MPRLFLFGIGYAGLAVAKALVADGWEVSGTCRTEGRRAVLVELGIHAYIFDRDHPLAPEAIEAIGGASHILNSVPPDDFGDPVLDAMAAHIAAANPEWVGYLSTTGVYGDRGGDWVNESSDLTPTNERSMRRVRAEGTWFVLWREGSVPVHIFRLAGIYGPGRSPLDALRAGSAQRIDKPGHVFSRIHVDDLVTVLRASMANPRPGSVYNVCDDEPVSPVDVSTYGAQLLGIDPPPLVPFRKAEMSDMSRSFYRDNKRVRNGKIKSDLGVVLKYPDYRTGLKSLI